MTEQLRFCKDCKFFRMTLFQQLFLEINFARCTHPKALELSADGMVDGKTGYYCSSMRICSCGTEAKYFEARKK